MIKSIFRLTILLWVVAVGAPWCRGDITTTNFFNWETPPVHPVDLSPDGTTLAVCNLPDDRVEIFSLTNGLPVAIGSVTVGLDPVSARFRTSTELWVANYISSSISIVDVPTMRVKQTLTASNEPSDIVFAGSPPMAFVSCGQPSLIEVINPANYQDVQNLALAGLRPRSMAASPDGTRVFVAFFESGNASTIISSPIAPLESLPHPNAVDLPQAPSGGLNPPPNSGTSFVPPLNPLLNGFPPPRVSLIVKKNAAGRWMDDDQRDWTEYITGTNAAFTGRVPGWDMPDHDLAVINTTNFSIAYASGLMNICMAVAVNPATGQPTVVGTDAINQIRFQPVLNGIFVRVEMALVNPSTLAASVVDLNPQLDYSSATTNEAERDLSIGDPRAVVWSADGTTGYVCGMGSSNIVLVDAAGNRLATNSIIPTGQGPAGMALDTPRGRLYVYNRFDGTVTVAGLSNATVVETIPLFNPTPQVISAGRPFFYDTHMTSGLGQVSCASCHVDGRTDRLAWDLGDPTSTVADINSTFNFAQPLPTSTNNYHPMKGPMTTLTMQDIIGHESFHWRGDRAGIEAFFITYTNLQGMANGGLTSNQMSQLKSFVATIGFPPNPHRNFDNTLSTNMPLPGQLALGRGTLPAGAPLPDGNAQNGLGLFQTAIANGCTSCHTLPTGLGTDLQFETNIWVQFPLGPNNAHHAALVQLPRSDNLPFKIPQLRNLFDKFGMSLSSTNSLAGFGFSHDGAVDTLPRFIQDSFLLTNDQETADLTAFLLSVTGSDLPGGSLTNPIFSPGLPSLDVTASTGFQITLTNGADNALVDEMIAQADVSTSRVDLIVKGMENGLARGWFFVRGSNLFQSDRITETETPAALRALAAPGSELTYTLVPVGSGERIGIDRDADGYFDRDELDYGSDPANAQSTPANTPPHFNGFSVTGKGAQVSWATYPGFVFQLQYKDDLTDPAWMNLAPSQQAASNSMSLTDPLPTNAVRFYRINAMP